MKKNMINIQKWQEFVLVYKFHSNIINENALKSYQESKSQEQKPDAWIYLQLSAVLNNAFRHIYWKQSNTSVNRPTWGFFKVNSNLWNKWVKALADPGFPRGGGANSPGGPTYEFAKFSQKLHENERIWTPRGVHVTRTPLRSATAKAKVTTSMTFHCWPVHSYSTSLPLPPVADPPWDADPLWSCDLWWMLGSQPPCARLWTEEMTHACENITLPKTSFAFGKNCVAKYLKSRQGCFMQKISLILTAFGHIVFCCNLQEVYLLLTPWWQNRTICREFDRCVITLPAGITLHQRAYRNDVTGNCRRMKLGRIGTGWYWIWIPLLRVWDQVM